MKRIYAILLILMLVGFVGNAEEPETTPLPDYSDEIDRSWCDTIAVIKDAHRVVITEKGRTATLVVNGSGSDNKFYYHYGVEPRVDTVAAPAQKIGIDVPFAGNLGGSSTNFRFLKNIYVGVNMPVGPGKDLKAGMEAGVAEVIGFGYTSGSCKSTLSVGFGFGYRSLNTSHGLLFAKDGCTLVLTGAPEGSSESSAIMDFWSLQFPVLYSQSIGSHNFGFSFGVVLNLNVSAKATSKWKIDDMTYKTKVDNLHQRFFTPDILLTIGKRDLVGAYLKFSPMDAMIRYHGPRMSMLSAGVNFNF